MVQKSESRDLDKVIIRLPDGMRDRIKLAAEANNRSMNAEIVSVLESYYGILGERSIKNATTGDISDLFAQQLVEHPEQMTDLVTLMKGMIEGMERANLKISDPKN